MAFARRTFFRASFAFLEANLYWLKGEVQKWLLAKAWRTQNIEVTKIVLLQDQVPKPDKTGKIDSERSRWPFLNTCAIILRTGAECWDLDPSTFFSDSGWDLLQKSLQVRHRITHPKQPSNLDVTEDELRAMRNAIGWFYNRVIDIINAAQMHPSTADPTTT